MNLTQTVDTMNVIPDSIGVRDSSSSHSYIRELSHPPPPPRNGRSSRSPHYHKSSKLTPNQKLSRSYSPHKVHTRRSHHKRMSSRSPSDEKGDGSKEHRSHSCTADRKLRQSPSSRSHSPRRSGSKPDSQSPDRIHHRNTSKPNSRSPGRTHNKHHRKTRSSHSSHKRGERTGVVHRASHERSTPHASKSIGSPEEIISEEPPITRTSSWGLLDTSSPPASPGISHQDKGDGSKEHRSHSHSTKRAADRKPNGRSPGRTHHKHHRKTRSSDEKRTYSSHKRGERTGVVHRASHERSTPHASKSSHASLIGSPEEIIISEEPPVTRTSSWGLLDTSSHPPSPGISHQDIGSSSRTSDNSRHSISVASVEPTTGLPENDDETDANTECAILPDLVYGTRKLRNPTKPSRSRHQRRSRPHHRHYIDSSVTVASIAVLTESDEDSDYSDDNTCSVTQRRSNTRRSTGSLPTRVSSATAKRTLYGDEGDAKTKEKASRGSSKHASFPGVEAVGMAPVRKSSSSKKAVGTLYGSDSDAKAKAKAGTSKSGAKPGATVVPLPATSAHKLHIAQGVKDGVLDEEGPVARRVLLAGTEDAEYESDFDLEGQSSQGTAVRKHKEQKHKEEPKKRRRRGVGLCLCLLLLLLIGVGIAVWFFLFRNNNQGTKIGSKAEDATTPSPQNSTATLPPVTPPTSPTTVPTAPLVLEELLFEPPSKQNCDAIARNLTIDGRDELENADFGLSLEVVLSEDNLITRPLVDELLSAIQEKILPSIAGCNVGADEYVEAWRFVIFDAFVTGNAMPEEKCNNRDLVALNCHRVDVELDVFLKGFVRFLDIIRLISAEEVNIANNLDLSDSFSIVQLVSIESLTSTNAPTIMPTNDPSVSPTDVPTREAISDPTLRPSIETTPVTTEVPSKRPTPPPTLVSIAPNTPLPNSDPTSRPSPPTPSVVPSVPATESPTERPTMAPPVVGSTPPPTDSPTTPSPTTSSPTTPSPTKAHTSPPTKSPTVAPTKSPTKSPTVAPTTLTPTTKPSSAPSPNPSANPSASPTSKSPTFFPTKSPTDSPSAIPTSPGTCCIQRQLLGQSHGMLFRVNLPTNWC